MEHIKLSPKTKFEQTNKQPSKKSFFPITTTLPALIKESNFPGYRISFFAHI